MFGRLKDWRRVATRYDRQPKGLPLSRRTRRNGHVQATDGEPVLTLGLAKASCRHSRDKSYRKDMG